MEPLLLPASFNEISVAPALVPPVLFSGIPRAALNPDPAAQPGPGLGPSCPVPSPCYGVILLPTAPAGMPPLEGMGWAPAQGLCGALGSEQSPLCETKGHWVIVIPQASWGCGALDLR